MPDSPSFTRLIAPLTQSTVAGMCDAMQAAAYGGADAVEVRLDFLPSAERSPERLSALFSDSPLERIATCRSKAEGGQCDLPAPERAALLALCVRLGCDWVDFEWADLAEAEPLLRVIEEANQSGRRVGLIASTHDFQGRPADLAETLTAMDQSPAAVCKAAFQAVGPEDACTAWDLVRANSKPTIALAMGPAGVASRILARKFGAFGTFAALSADACSAPGQPTLAEMAELYCWADQSPRTELYGVVGCPVGHSMSPAVHNAAFRAVHYDATYVPFHVEPGREAFDRFLDAFLQRPWAQLRGLSVTIPHKENAMARVGEGNVDALSRAIGAINTVGINERGVLRGTNTDYAGAIGAIVEALDCEPIDLAGRSAAVLGAGGAARAIVAGLAEFGADTTIYNRTVSRAEALAERFDRFGMGKGRVRAVGLEGLDRLRADIIINCTPIGMHPDADGSPLPQSLALEPQVTVFDTIYNPLETRMLRHARRCGCRTVSGLEMFVKQAAAQFEFWLGVVAPHAVMRQVVLKNLG